MIAANMFKMMKCENKNHKRTHAPPVVNRESIGVNTGSIQGQSRVNTGSIQGQQSDVPSVDSSQVAYITEFQSSPLITTNSVINAWPKQSKLSIQGQYRVNTGSI